ncbi:TIGR02680 family protein [Nocardia sp. AG03]|uniref:TIGR02680 family protein n=1 Tax=Nocardia sp. AG03 TaxID=3025312 RepID=UPI002418BAF4|nr:TIGR02680 family protein [Nocardia sp. AG03]
MTELDDTRLRWVPTRAGILNVWRYYDEVLEFHDGRLLLRGANGSGKSKALELLLPFLFDASLRPNRLSTFGTGERTMHWNMMGEGATGVTRVGYVWLEFRRGPAQWFTCGARLQATTRTTTVRPDFFTTELRVGQAGEEDVLVLTESGRPVTRAELVTRIGERGTVHDDAPMYRNTVRTKLFPGLSDQRFDALITALLQLRMPKLSQRLDPGLLSNLLSKALPPLGDNEIADLAEGFERLDAQRERLERLRGEAQAVAKLAVRQRTYAQRVLRARAAALVSATTELGKRSDDAKRSAAELATARTDLSAAQVETGRHRAAVGKLRSRQEGLLKSPAYQHGAQLDDLRRARRGAERRATQAAEREAERERAALTAAGLAETTATEMQDWEQIVARSVAESRQAGQRCAMTAVTEEIAAAEPARARIMLRATVTTREEQIGVVRAALDEHDRVIWERDAAELTVDAARTRFGHTEAAMRAAGEHRDATVEELRSKLRDWADGCRMLSPDCDRLVRAAESEADCGDIITAAVTAASVATHSKARETEGARDEARAERAELVEERDQLRNERDIPPPVPVWRTADRTERPGAPLWQVVDFADSVSIVVAGAVEAALESAGLLDAWIGPDGSVDGAEVFAVPEAVAAVGGVSLTTVLEPADSSAVPAALVERLLASIAFGESAPDQEVVAIGADGSWRMANLRGGRNKPSPEFIGVQARRRARQQRICEIDQSVLRLDHRLDEFAHTLRELEQRVLLIDDEYRRRPGRAELADADIAFAQSSATHHAADGELRTATDKLRDTEAWVSTSMQQLAVLGATHRLPTDRPALVAFAQALHRFSDIAESWIDARSDLGRARDNHDRAVAQAALARTDADSAAADAVGAAAELSSATTELTAIEETVGRDYQDVLVELDTVRTALATAEASEQDGSSRISRLTAAVGGLERQTDTDEQARIEAVADRDTAATRLRELATGTLPADAEIPDLAHFHTVLAESDGVRATLDAARLITAAWDSTPHAPTNVTEALGRLGTSVHECRAELGGRADLDLETRGEVQIFTASIDGIRVGAAELKRILEREAEHSRTEITEHERTLFDRTLTGDTRRHLTSRIRQADTLVKAMNERLGRVRTASDVAVQLVWQVGKDLPAGTKAARDLLLKAPAQLGDADRESLHRFLRERIDEAKADATATSWGQQLTQVFDYTRWHQFVVRVDRGKGEGYQELTKKLHGALSGGEKAIALHLPLFAAVAAHYEATPEAPRMIMLDEVFVGVDTVNRGQIFALLGALDLDLLLTSDHEWCMYRELSGIAIHQLVHGDGSDAVTSARFTWDGQELIGA